MRVTGTAPRILLNVGGKANPSVNAIGRLAGTPAQRLALRTLLEAPVEGERGTLGVFSHDVNAGKSGSTQSNAVDPTGRRYAHGKWAVTFRVDRHEINLFMVASPLPSLPLAHHAIGPTLFAPAHRVLIANTKENTR